MLPLAKIMKYYNISYHNYADDIQLYITVSPHDYSPLYSLIKYMEQINEWMCQNFLQLNTEKTEIIVFGPKEERLKVSAYLDSMTLKSTNHTRNLGVIMDSDLNFNSHIKTITKSAYYHLTNIARIKGFLSKQDTEKLVCAFSFSRLDYCNAVTSSLRQLQLVQNAASSVLINTKKVEHITPVLRSLHWLPVCQRIDFKILLVVYKALNGLEPKYISNLFVYYETSRPLRASATGLLSVTRMKTK